MAKGAKEVKEVPPHLQELATTLPVTMGLAEAAQALCVHPRTVQRMIRVGELQAMRPKLSGGSRLIIPRSEIIRWCIEHSAR
jgi:excisionase family DNA binding protein